MLARRVDKRTRTADHPTTAKHRDLARKCNPRSQARSLAQLQEITDFGQEPAGVTDRMIVFETFVGECETSSGEALGVQVKCPRHHEADWRDGHGNQTIQRQWEKRQWKPTLCMDKGKKSNHAKGKKGKDKGKGKHRGKHESSPKFEGCCGHCG